MTKTLNVVFAGTPDFAARHLQALADSEHNVIAVYTQPDRPAGRGKKLQASAVKQLAESLELPVFQPENFKSQEAKDELAALKPDVMVVVAYGLILPQVVLDIPTFGCINVHGSLLPRWRGAAPIQRAIWAGDAETGVTIMQMDKGLDTGDMLRKSTCVIAPEDTSASLYEKLAQSGPVTLLDTLTDLANGTAIAEKQNNDEANYAEKLSKQEALIDWTDSAIAIERSIRAFNPWPVSYFELGGNNVKVWQANIIEQTPDKPAGHILGFNKKGIQIATGEHILNITSLQPPGKKPMSAADFINARADWLTNHEPENGQ